MASVPDRLEVHPAAEFFPPLGDAEFEAFKADIAAVGLLEPIWLCGGKILDGRNRYRACQELGIAPRFRTYTGDSPVAFAWSLNGERRHLTNGQRAAIGVEMLPSLQEEAKKRQLAGLRRGAAFPVTPELGERGRKLEAVEAAAAIVGASGTNIQYAKAIKERDPETFQKLRNGELNVGAAYSTMKKRVHAASESKPRNQPREKRLADIERLAKEGNRGEQIAEELGISAEHVRELAHKAKIALPDDVIGRRRRLDSHRMIEETVSTLEGLALGLRTISGARLACSAVEAQQWVTSIDASMRVISRLRKVLRSYIA